MGRSIILVSHCVLNQNAVVEPLARAPGPLAEALRWIQDRQYAIYQLPCPEFRFLGPKRVPTSVDGYNTPGFHSNNRRILVRVVADLESLIADGWDIAGAILIERSPSCDPRQGNWAWDLFEALERNGIPIGDIRQVPVENGGIFRPDSDDSFFGPPCLRQGPPGGARLRRDLESRIVSAQGKTPGGWRKTEHD